MNGEESEVRKMAAQALEMGIENGKSLACLDEKHEDLSLWSKKQAKCMKSEQIEMHRTVNKIVSLMSESNNCTVEQTKATTEQTKEIKEAILLYKDIQGTKGMIVRLKKLLSWLPRFMVYLTGLSAAIAVAWHTFRDSIGL